MSQQRENMVAQQIAARGIHDPRVLDAMRKVPRERFVSTDLASFAYDDTPLGIDEGQTISQPYIVALMAEAAMLEPTDRVLEVGTGSGYAAAVLAELAGEVVTIERHEKLAHGARARLRELGYGRVKVVHGDGTLGWPDGAPYEAIVVSAGAPEPPTALLAQLAIGGRLIIPIGATQREQSLLRITRRGPHDFRREDLGGVRFVPLIGTQGWSDVPKGTPAQLPGSEPIVDIDTVPLESLLARIGDAEVVLLGEASHGTSEFYRMRARITKELIEKKGFRAMCIEGDWPDAARVDRRIRGLPPSPGSSFTRFPTWMWRNEEIAAFLDWLRVHNRSTDAQVRFYGLDLYSMYGSIDEIIRYLEKVDPEAATSARARYGCLTPWQDDPALYGRAALGDGDAACEKEVTVMLRDLLVRRENDDPLFDAQQNARLVANAERYYRVLYYGSRASWNLRDEHMFETLQQIRRRDGSKVVVWAHNTHCDDARATEMGQAGELNLGQLCRMAYGDKTYVIGFGTDHGTVAAAHDWDEPMQIMRINPSRPGSYERLFHDVGMPAFLLPLRGRTDLALLGGPKLMRAIGVVYRPTTELQSHYLKAQLLSQYDEYIWFDTTSAVKALPTQETPAPRGTEDTFPTGW